MPRSTTQATQHRQCRPPRQLPAKPVRGHGWIPEIQLKSASGKIQRTHQDITDFVNVAEGGSVKQVLGECGGARVLVKSGPAKPKDMGFGYGAQNVSR